MALVLALGGCLVALGGWWCPGGLRVGSVLVAPEGLSGCLVAPGKVSGDLRAVPGGACWPWGGGCLVGLHGGPEGWWRDCLEAWGAGCLVALGE